MDLSDRRWALRTVAAGLMSVTVVLAASAQDMSRARAEYLGLRGLDDEASALEEYLLTELGVLGYENADNLSRFFSFVMA
ncbi:MAG: hypothetical protein R3178_08660, partial [Rhodothermales bacterium]|nr:hypothetical protein [Rhodothermales bacterium]